MKTKAELVDELMAEEDKFYPEFKPTGAARAELIDTYLQYSADMLRGLIESTREMNRWTRRLNT